MVYHNRLLIFFSILLTISCRQRSVSSAKNNNHVALFIFGDSLFDSGNNNYLPNAIGRANFYPYGETFFHNPTGRFSDGRIIPDFIAEYLKLPLIPPYLQPGNHDDFKGGANFASGGAGALVNTYQGHVVELKTQLSHFKDVAKQLRQKLGEKESKVLLSKAIFIFSIGSNDYAEPFITNSTYQFHDFTREQYVGFVIGNFTSVLHEIYKIGGRKFGFINVGPLACLPSFKAFEHYHSVGFLKEVTAKVKLHNMALLKMLRGLKRKFNGFQYSHFDFHKATTDRIKQPSKYGFKDGKVSCCGGGMYRGVEQCGKRGYQVCKNPSEYVFFDGGHPSQHFNEQIAKLMWHGSSKFTVPFNLQALLI